VPVPHQEPQDFVGFGKGAERMRLRLLAPEHLRQVLAGHHDIGTGNQGGEKPVKFLDVHGLAALATLEEFPEAVELRVCQRLVLGKDSHRRLQGLPSPAYDTLSGSEPGPTSNQVASCW